MAENELIQLLGGREDFNIALKGAEQDEEAGATLKGNE